MDLRTPLLSSLLTVDTVPGKPAAESKPRAFVGFTLDQGQRSIR